MLTGPSIQENGGTVGIRKINKQKIEVKFASLLTNVHKKLREKQINPEDLSFLANSIFLREYIPKSSSINEIFEAMNRNRLWDYWNYYLLEEFILDSRVQSVLTVEWMKSTAFANSLVLGQMTSLGLELKWVEYFSVLHAYIIIMWFWYLEDFCMLFC